MKSAFDEIEKKIEKRNELEIIRNELKYYQIFKAMKNSGKTTEEISTLIEDNTQNFNDNNFWNTVLSLSVKDVSRLFNVSRKSIKDAKDALRELRKPTESIFTSDLDIKAANRAYEFLSSDKLYIYDATLRQLEEYKDALESGVSFDNLREMVKTDVNLYAKKDEIDFDEFSEIIYEEVNDNDKAEELVINMFSELYNTETASKSISDSRKKVLALCLIKKELED